MTTTRTPLRRPETSDERLTAIETHLPYLATREDVLITREYVVATREHMERSLREQSENFHAALLKHTADMQAQMRSDRRWTIGTIITVGLAIVGIMIRLVG